MGLDTRRVLMGEERRMEKALSQDDSHQYIISMDDGDE